MDTQKKGKDLVYGTIVEALPNAMFKVVLDKPSTPAPVAPANSDQNSSQNDGHGDGQPAPLQEERIILAFLAGKMVYNRIRVGERVALEIVDPQGTRGRISRRM